MSRLNQLPLRVALFPLFEEVGESLLSGQVALDDFAQARLSVPGQDHCRWQHSGLHRVFDRALLRPVQRETVLIVVIRRSPARHFFGKWRACMSAASLSLFIAMATPRSMTASMR